jgi:hypothetical protein
MTRDDVQGWLDRYVAAWLAYDAAAIGELFSDDAEYRYHPWDEPVRGIDAIVHDWLNPGGSADRRDKPGTWSARYEPWAVDGLRAVVIGETRYFTDASQAVEEKRYWNNWLIEFDDDGRCRSFVEYYMQRKKPATKAG